MKKKQLSPIAKAIETFMSSEGGRRLCSGTVSGRFLRNRIEAAFIAGLDCGFLSINEVTLKPCPFCGQPATIVMNPGHNWGGKIKHVNVGACFHTWYVGCPSQYYEGSLLECAVHPAACWYANLIDAIKAWETRKDSVFQNEKKRT